MTAFCEIAHSILKLQAILEDADLDEEGLNEALAEALEEAGGDLGAKVSNTVRLLREAGEKIKNDNSVFADRLSEAIRHSGKSKRQIALAIGVRPQSATKWKKLGYLAKERIPAFCRETGVNMEWLLSGKGDLVGSNPLSDATDEQVIKAALDLPVNQQGSLIQQLADLISKARDSL